MCVCGGGGTTGKEGKMKESRGQMSPCYTAEAQSGFCSFLSICFPMSASENKLFTKTVNNPTVRPPCFFISL